MNLRFRDAATTALLIWLTISREATAANVDLAWSQAQDGLWSVAGNWNPTIVPNNTTDLYRVTINQGTPNAPVTVALDISPNIRDLSIGAGSRLNIADGRALTITGEFRGGGVTNSGAIQLGSAASPGTLRVLQDVDLTGGGEIIMGHDAATIRDGWLYQDAHTIRGFGQLGQNTLGIQNGPPGVIDANVLDKTLIVDPEPLFGVINAGQMRATQGGTLRLDGAGGGEINNLQGVIRAGDASTVLLNGVHIKSGFLSTQGSGQIVVPAGSFASLFEVNNQGKLVVSDGAELTVDGAIFNLSEILLGSPGGEATLNVLDHGAFVREGVIRMASDHARIIGTRSLGQAGHRIEGFGQVGANTMGIYNTSGVIEANVPREVLVLDPSPEFHLQNRDGGRLRSNNRGILRLSGNGGGDFINTALIEIEGRLELTEGALLRNSQIANIGQAGHIGGPGVLDATDGIFESGAIVEPGGFNNVGVFTILGDYAQEDTGILRIKLGGRAVSGYFDQLDVQGTATLAGKLEVSALGYTPAYGEAYEIMTFESRNGVFDTLQVPQPNVFGMPPMRAFYSDAFVVIASLLEGDTNVDGVVNIEDLNLVRNNFGLTRPDVPGDTNFDGRVDVSDLNNVRNNFGAELPNPVPEPDAAMLFLVAAATRCLRRLRRGRASA